VTNLGRIGPHEEIEFALFEAGEKHVIYFSWDWQPDDHMERASRLGAKSLVFEDQTFKKNCYIYYRDGYFNIASELRDILNSGFSIYDEDWETKEYRIGVILGYTKNDVSLYIKNFRDHHKKS